MMYFKNIQIKKINLYFIAILIIAIFQFESSSAIQPGYADCMKDPFATACRGISAKRSELPVSPVNNNNNMDNQQHQSDGQQTLMIKDDNNNNDDVGDSHALNSVRKTQINRISELLNEFRKQQYLSRNINNNNHQLILLDLAAFNRAIQQLIRGFQLRSIATSTVAAYYELPEAQKNLPTLSYEYSANDKTKTDFFSGENSAGNE